MKKSNDEPCKFLCEGICCDYSCEEHFADLVTDEDCTNCNMRESKNDTGRNQS